MNTRLGNLLRSISIFCLLATAARAELALTFGLYSQKKPTEMIAQYRPLLNELETRLTRDLGTPVKIHTQVVKTYEEGIKAIVEGTFDFSQVGPVAYVGAKEQAPGIEILALEGTRGAKTVNGVICVLSNSPIRSVTDLKGRTFAFGDQFSTTGRYNSQQYLMEHGVRGQDLARFDYLERHDRVGSAVAGGDFDAGALNERTFKKLVEQGSHLRALAYFPIVGRPWIARNGLPENVRANLRKALLEVKDPKILSALGEDGLTMLPGEDADYNSTRTAVKENVRFAERLADAP